MRSLATVSAICASQQRFAIGYAVVSASNRKPVKIYQLPLLPRLAVRFNLPLCEFLEFDVRGAIAFIAMFPIIEQWHCFGHPKFCKN
jgi:hypothetical protein